MKKIMITLPGGGHLWQSISVIRNLGGAYDFCYICPKGSMFPTQAELPSGETIRVTSFISISTLSKWIMMRRFIKSFYEMRASIRKLKPDVIVGIGSALAVPLLIAAKFAGVPGVFIESITRVNDLSVTGKIILRLGLAEKFYVQWPEVHNRYKNTIYEGTVM